MSEITQSLRDILCGCAEQALDKQRSDGSMPAGHNGPWDDPETPVRNTGHWAITFLRCHEWTGDDRFLTAGEQATDYLLSDKARPHGYTYHHLIEADANKPNGLVGQAWSIEALATAGVILDRPELLDLAAEVFLLHPFDETLGAWRVVDIDGDLLGFDLTFNHQLWFAAAGSTLVQHDHLPEAIEQQVQRFLTELESNITVSECGLIKHPFKPRLNPLKYAKIGIDAIRTGELLKLARGAFESEVAGGMIGKAVGYQSFNLYGLALLAAQFPNHVVWESKAIERAVSFVQTEQFHDRLDGNPYGYLYNVSGIELAYAEQILGTNDPAVKAEWIGQQLKRTYNSSTHTIGANTNDPTTVGARIYEATRITDITLSEGFRLE